MYFTIYFNALIALTLSLPITLFFLHGYEVIFFDKFQIPHFFHIFAPLFIVFFGILLISTRGPLRIYEMSTWWVPFLWNEGFSKKFSFIQFCVSELSFIMCVPWQCKLQVGTWSVASVIMSAKWANKVVIGLSTSEEMGS